MKTKITYWLKQLILLALIIVQVGNVYGAPEVLAGTAEVSEEGAVGYDIVKSWRVLDGAGRPILKTNVEALEALSKILANPKLESFGLTDEILGSLKGGMSTGNAKGFKDIMNSLDEFVTRFDPKNLNDFSKIIDDLRKGGSFTEGAEWTISYLNKNSSLFSSKKLRFEVKEVWSVSENKFIRIADVVDETDILSPKYFEFKSYSSVPPNNFPDQFVKDLSRSDVTDLNQVKWMFDGRKSPADFEKNMRDAIENLDLDDALARKFLKDQNAKADELKDLLDAKFADIFDLHNILE